MALVSRRALVAGKAGSVEYPEATQSESDDIISVLQERGPDLKHSIEILWTDLCQKSVKSMAK